MVVAGVSVVMAHLTGSGGAIRLVAPIIDVASATLIAVGGLGSSQNPGRIRLEGNSINMSGNIHISAPYSTSALFKTCSAADSSVLTSGYKHQRKSNHCKPVQLFRYEH